MALCVTLRINDSNHHAYVAQRIGSRASGKNRYRVFKHFIVDDDELKLEIGKVTHNYADGADVLALKVLKLALRVEKCRKN